MRRFVMVVSILVAGAVVAGDVCAQTAQTPPAGQTTAKPGPGRAANGRAAAAAEGQPISPAELQRLFDAYFILQAQDALKVDDARFADLLPRLKALQDTRRRHEQERRQAIAEMGKLSVPGAATDEATLREKLRALQELESRSAAELRKAYDGVDQLLDVRQQVRFRIFEQSMERRKLELMLRARRGDAPAPGGTIR